MAQLDHSVATSPASTGLAKNSLTTWDAIAISVSVLAPGMAMQLNTGGVAQVAGGSTPLAFLLGGVACLTLAFVVIGFTRRMASAGYAYTYASRSLGKRPGFMAGWLYAFGLICFVPMTMGGVGYLASDLLGLDPNWWILFFLIGMALLVVLSVVRIKVTTRVQLLVGALTVLVLLVVAVVVAAKGGAHGQSLGAFTFSHTASHGFNGVFYGIILGVTSYIGFETAADFGEETANPRRSIPIAVIAATLFAIVFYLFITYATTIGYGTGALAKDPTPWVNGGVAGVAERYLGHAAAKLIEIGAMLSAFVVCVGCATAGTRTLFAMGRERVLPEWFGRTHPRFKTPANATFVVAALSTVVAVVVGYGLYDASFGAPRALQVYYVMATIGTLAVILVYIELCIGGMAFFRRTRARYNLVVHALVPLVGAVIFAAAWYGSVHPLPPYPISISPWVVIAWVLLGLAFLGYVQARRPDAIDRIGSILGEEGGTDAAVLDTRGVVAPPVAS